MQTRATPPAVAPPGTRSEHPGDLPARSWLRAVWPALVVALGFLVLLGLTVREVKANEHGHFVYTLDDTYFHMAVARNLLHHGLWGVNVLDGFSSGTSSLLWPLVITVSFALFGVHEYFPLVLNVLVDLGLLFYAGWLVRRTTGSNLLSFLVLAALVVLTPLLALASTGMEHSLQTLLGVIFVDLAARLLTDDAQRLDTRSAPRWLCAVGTLLVMTRYEGLFLVAPVGLLLLCRRRWALAVSLGVTAAAPVVLFGLLAVSKGWYFLPNSLLIKGNTQVVLTAAGLLEYFGKWYSVLTTERHLFVLVTASAAALLGSLQRRWTLWSYPALFLFITLLALVQHLQFAGVGWFYRYEAYLVVLALLGIGIALGFEPSGSGWRYWLSARALPHYVTLALVAGLLGPPLWTRGIQSVHHVVTASYNIYEQQYQMGRFVRRFYDGKGVLANDVGAISFFGHIRLVDVVGLSDIAVLRARRAGTLRQETIEHLCQQRHVDIAIIYDSWQYLFGGTLPPAWVRVGRWTIPHNTIAGSDTVSFYALDRSFVPKIARQLQEFSGSLPPDVSQDGFYRGNIPPEVEGTYGPEPEGTGTSYWTGQWAQFNVRPAKPVPPGTEATLKLAVLPITPGQTIEVFFNDQPVGSHVFAPGAPPGWTPLEVPVQWRPGLNALRLVGHGTPLHVPNDYRLLLFKVFISKDSFDQSEKPAPPPFP